LTAARTCQADKARARQLGQMAQTLDAICHGAPQTFAQALQLFWLYALLAGVINYGRLDDLLGPYLQADLDAGRITEAEAYESIQCLWRMIENRRTTVNGRIIVGGRGRKHPKAADTFLRLAMRAATELRYVEPQFTLRITDDMPEEIWNSAIEALGRGATYPTLYNDEVNIPAIMHAMRVDEQTAEQYVPFGCGEYVIAGQSIGTPNTCINLLKLLQIALNDGIDPMDGKNKSGGVSLQPAAQLDSFEALWAQYTRLLDYYMDLSVKAQTYSYQVMQREVSFLFTSLLMDDCIARGKAVLDGGVRYLGGTNETYGNINTSDALYAVKTLVYEQKKYTLPQLVAAANTNFSGAQDIRTALWRCDKYGNDLDTADTMANRLYEYVAQGVRERGIAAGMQYYLIVISNNQLNTEWGRRTAASLDGRRAGQFMNPANNPQGGANTHGPTALLNSLAKFDARLHGASVQNIKFSTPFFRENREKIKALFKTYFKRGGCHLMVTVIDHGVLEDAVKHPEQYADLIVRVSGFSAVFVNLEPDIQRELMSRVMYE
ncbi:MAG: pyruvate formate lyase family protein, partial [Ruthenibacterium sp.]